MKTKLKSRELLWMTLPVLIIGMVAWWLSAGGKMPIQAPNVKGMVADARRPALSLQTVTAKWVSPTQRAFLGNEQGCVVSVAVDASAFLGQIRPSKVPSFISTDIVDEKGRSIKATLGKKRSFSSTTAYTGIPTGTTWGSAAGQGVPNATYEVYVTVPFVHLPRTTKRAVMSGVVGWGTASAIPVKFDVLPAWMRRTATRLQVERVSWRHYIGNQGSEVEVICRVAKPNNLYVFGFDGGTTSYSARLGLGYDPKLWTVPAKSDKNDVILGEWSQRIESGDGRLNSLDLLRDHMEKAEDQEERLNPGKAHYQEDLMESFNPLCRIVYAGVKYDRVRLLYDISGVPKKFKNPVFLCEIYLVGDGMVRVRYPLPSKHSSEAR